MNKIVKRILLLISLLVALLIAVVLISNLFCKAASFDERRLGYYENEPKNSIDVVFIGASEIYAGWAPGLAYKEYGFTSYPYCISAAPVTLWKPMLQEVLKKQKPKLIVVDPYGATMDANDTAFGLDNPAPKYQFLNTIPFSADKVKMVEDLCGGMKTIDKMSYLFPFVKHHDSYVDFAENYRASSEIRQKKTSALKGMRTLTEVHIAGTPIKETTAQDIANISEKGKQSLKSFLSYCKENNLNVVFVHFPAVIAEGNWKYEINAAVNYAGTIANSYGYEYLNLQNKLEEMGILYNEDFYQPSHLNIKGQRKITLYLGKHLSDIYLKGRVKHNQQDEENWNDAYMTYEKYYEYACNNITNGISEYLDDGPETIGKIEKGK